MLVVMASYVMRMYIWQVRGAFCYGCDNIHGLAIHVSERVCVHALHLYTSDTHCSPCSLAYPLPYSCMYACVLLVHMVEVDTPITTTYHWVHVTNYEDLLHIFPPLSQPTIQQSLY